MDKQYRLRKVNQKGRRRTPGGLKHFHVGDIYICRNEEEFKFLLTYEPHHWENADPEPEPVKAPEPKPKPEKKKATKKGGDE